MDKERQYKTPLHRRKYKAKLSKELRDYYKEHGICEQCGQNYAEPGHVLCINCRRKYLQNQKKYDPDGSKHKTYVKALRESRLAAGLCVDCGKKKHVEGYVRCPSCMKRDKERCQLYRIRKRIREQKGR